MSEKLNCWPGCNAIFVKSFAGNEGKIVRCVEFLGEVKFKRVGKLFAWRIDRNLPNAAGGVSDIAMDSALRPLRDAEGQDEMLRIAGIPNKETTPAAH